MSNTHLVKMAQILVHYSLEVQPGQLVLLTGDLEGMPLYDALYVELLKARVHVSTQFIPPRWEEIFYRHASEEQLMHLSPFVKDLTEKVHHRIRVIAPSNTRALSGVDPAKQACVSRARAPLLATTLARSARGDMNWVVTLCPTQALAQEANMGLEEYTDFVFQAAFLYESDPIAKLRALEAQQADMIQFLETKKELHFTTPHGTDLYVNIDGMRWRNSCGRRNFPDGEVFTGPNLKAQDGGVNGRVRYTYPAILQNTVVEDVELVFEKGVVVQATAKRHEDFLQAMLKQDPGASRLGEIAIGTNYNIQKFTHNILFDEKIGGTFHAALGMGYPETGNTNQSALHWDMICDLREGGEIRADGELISSGGKFLKQGWPSC